VIRAVARFLPTIQVVTFIAIAISAGVAAYNSYREYRKEGIERTYAFMRPLSEDQFIANLWSIEEFTICLERKFSNVKDIKLSYLEPINTKNTTGDQKLLSKEWWKVVEDENYLYMNLEKPQDIEKRLWFVYTKISNIASCLETELCRYDVFMNSIDSVDVITFLGFSNYILMAEASSREWFVDPNLKKWVDKVFEKYRVFIGERREKLQNRFLKCSDYNKRYFN
jgi:hypothetical protein